MWGIQRTDKMYLGYSNTSFGPTGEGKYAPTSHHIKKNHKVEGHFFSSSEASVVFPIDYDGEINKHLYF